jgi:hypothetical protein
MSEWQKEHIHFLSRSYRHPASIYSIIIDFKGMKVQLSKDKFDDPNVELFPKRYKSIYLKQLEHMEDYSLSPSKFGKTWVDLKR